MIAIKISADASRLRLIKELLETDLYVYHLADIPGMSQTNIAHYLAKLYAASMVQYRKDGLKYIIASIKILLMKIRNYLGILRMYFVKHCYYEEDIHTLRTTDYYQCMT